MKLRVIFIACLTLAMASCTVSGVKSVSEFEQSWESSGKNSAVSWWYVGETDNMYFLTEKHPLAEHRYELPKTEFTLKGITSMPPCKACKGQNLRAGQVIYHDQPL